MNETKDATAKPAIPLSVKAAVLVLIAEWVRMQANELMVEGPLQTWANPWMYPGLLLIRLIPLWFIARELLRLERWVWWFSVISSALGLIVIIWAGPNIILRPAVPKPFFANDSMYIAALVTLSAQLSCLLLPPSLKAFGIRQSTTKAPALSEKN